MAQPSVLVFDVNETLSNMSPMAERFAELGAPAPLAKQWFAALLRDGFALTSVGARPLFMEVAAETARMVLAGAQANGAPLNRGMDEAVQHILRGMAELSVHPDVADGARALRRAGLRLVTLSNGPAEIAESLLTQAGLRGEFEQVLSVEDAPTCWKPLPAAYEHASQVCHAPLPSMMLVAVHPWDIHGAAGAGMQTAWLNRSGGVYPRHFDAPDREAASLGDLAAKLMAD